MLSLQSFISHSVLKGARGSVSGKKEEEELHRQEEGNVLFSGQRERALGHGVTSSIGAASSLVTVSVHFIDFPSLCPATDAQLPRDERESGSRSLMIKV